MSSNMTENYRERVYRFGNAPADYTDIKNYSFSFMKEFYPISYLRMAYVPDQPKYLNKYLTSADENTVSYINNGVAMENVYKDINNNNYTYNPNPNINYKNYEFSFLQNEVGNDSEYLSYVKNSDKDNKNSEDNEKTNEKDNKYTKNKYTDYETYSFFLKNKK